MHRPAHSLQTSRPQPLLRRGPISIAGAHARAEARQVLASHDLRQPLLVAAALAASLLLLQAGDVRRGATGSMSEQGPATAPVRAPSGWTPLAPGAGSRQVYV